MRRKDKEINDPQLINQILQEANIVRFGIKAEPVPYVVPLNYGYKNHCFYIHSARLGRKIELLKANPMVSFEIEHQVDIVKKDISCEWTTKYRSIMGIAKVQILSEKKDIIEGLDILMQHHGKMENAYDENYFQRIVILKAQILEIEGKQSGDFD